MGNDSVLAAYEAFASIYNDFNHLNDYEMWLGRALLPALEEQGLKHGRVLDVGCGTGRAFDPLLRRGWRIQGCDLSPAMLEIARRERGDRADLAVADIRDLPFFGQFELVIALNDLFNFLLEENDLERALTGIHANLADHGLLVFDCNSISYFESSYTTVREVEYDGRHWTWRGFGETAPGLHETRIEGDDIEPIIHRERFHTQADVREAVAATGLECRAVLGMEEVGGEVVLTEPPDENRHYKVIYIAGKAGPST